MHLINSLSLPQKNLVTISFSLLMIDNHYVNALNVIIYLLSVILIMLHK